MLTRLRKHDEQGFTLIESLVVIVILGVVGTFVTSALIQGMRTSSDAQNRIYVLTDLQRGIERVARELRVADPLCVTTVVADQPRRLGASVYRDGKRYRYDYYLSGTGADAELLQDLTVFDPADSVTGTLVDSGVFIADIANDLIPDGANPTTALFAYRNRDGDEIPATGAVAAVEINLAKQLPQKEPVMVSTTVEVRNTRYTGTGGTCA